MYTTEQIRELIASGSIHDFYADYYWRKIAHQVIEEQKECQICKSKGRYSRGVIAHHVNMLKVRPDLAYEKYYTDKYGKRHRNIIAVCRPCHEAIHETEWHKSSRELFRNDELWE